eukprot:TRINITY_DN251_c0_g2_i1.p2 TRINITY_DN251_c0_g2~~TRINITY_DN251_c0_g2_i1.p2  ORF type:complete len:126 (+),score=5.83 TRINITY_DN251_c0_g2_i1:552-929(+)
MLLQCLFLLSHPPTVLILFKEVEKLLLQTCRRVTQTAFPLSHQHQRIPRWNHEGDVDHSTLHLLDASTLRALHSPKYFQKLCSTEFFSPDVVFVFPGQGRVNGMAKPRQCHRTVGAAKSEKNCLM